MQQKISNKCWIFQNIPFFKELLNLEACFHHWIKFKKLVSISQFWLFSIVGYKLRIVRYKLAILKTYKS